jgi:molecular chaperone HtpG
MKDNRLYKLLQKKEENVFGEKNYPLTTNIGSNLIPVAELLLNKIPAYMPEYTLHDINHCKAILDNIDKILPKDVELNIVELLILIQAVILHDIGMVVNRVKAEKIKESEDFKKLFVEFDKGTDEDEILTEFIRRTHVDRSLEYIDDFKKDYSTYKIDFTFKGIDISDWVKKVILSHALPIERLYCDNEYPVDKIIDSNTVNVRYLSILLRLGDILDFDIFRTPYFLYKHINPENKISDEEWQKHLSIEGRILTESTIKFEAKCSSAKIERSVHSFVNWIENERKDSINLITKSNTPKYKLELNEKSSIKVRNDGSYIYTELKLDLDYTKVLNILMGTELYETPDIFIRELLQNSYDACKYRKELANNAGEAYFPKILICYDSKSNTILIEDNGIGIDNSTFENYVLKIGNSYYQGKSFEQEQLKFSPISNFGIGILSCFMVSDTIEVDSLKFNKANIKSEPINYTLNFNDRYIDKKKTEKNSFGTTIRLNLHKEYAEKLKIKSIVEIIKENTAHQKIPITVQVDKKEILLDLDEIKVPKEYLSISDIEILKLDDIDWLEGFIVIHKGQHQQIIEHNKISQQGFTITTKSKNIINLNIGWLQFCRFFINILPEKKLNLRASRNSVKEDDKLAYLRNTIIELVVDYFSSSKNKPLLYQYINEGRGNVLSGNTKELDFLLESIELTTLNSKSFKILKTSIKTFLNKCNSKISVVVISPIVFAHLSKNPDFIGEMKNYDYIIIADATIQFFYQLSKPCTESNEIIVSEIPGLVYNNLVIHKKKALKVGHYDLKYSWHRTYNIGYNQDYKSLFCVVNNNQYNSMDIQINNQHPLGQLLKTTEKNTYSKRFLGSFKTNITYALINNRKLEKYFSHNGESHFMVNNFYAYSLNTIGFMKKSFIESLNKSLGNELLMPFLEQGLIKSTENYLITEKDFPSWWIEK